ncbi:MAG: hypothetical protein KDD50_08975, partial [Bdellovibrionales bacterium]|nr:hypothetical protein [Bdellovibrionales bacterium]
MDKSSMRPLNLNQNFQFVDETDPLKIPLPNELPSPLNIQELAVAAQRSSTIEALLSQNEDLMARLAVNLRRSAQLEQKLNSYEQTHQELLKKHENLKDQIMILKQKDRLLSDRHANVDQTIHDLQDKIMILEIQYAEYYETSQQQIDNFENTIQKLQTKLSHKEYLLSRYKKYRTKISNIAKSFRTKNFSLEEELIHAENSRQEIQDKLSEAVEHIQTQAKQHKESEKNLVDGYEQKLSQLQSQIESLTQSNQKQQVELVEQAKIYENNIKLKNEIVSIDRKSKEQQAKAQKEVARLQEQALTHRQSAKSNALQIKNLEEKVIELEKSEQTTKQDNERLVEQVESLQFLWKDNQDEIDKLTGQNKALQKLN